MTPRAVRATLAGILVACAFVLGITRVHDSDAWTHLALGRELVERGGFPATESLNFPSVERPYYNAEWLFGILAYVVWAAAGLTGVILVKAALAALAAFVIWRDALVPAEPRVDARRAALVAAAVVLPFVLLARHRVVERPDLVLMVLLPFAIHALNAYVADGRRLIFLLPLTQVLWVNVQPSIVLVAVPFTAVLVGGALQRGLDGWRGVTHAGTPSWRKLRTVASVFGAVLVASLANPYGVEPFMAPFRLAGAAWWRHEIEELQAPRFPAESAPFVVAALLIVGFLLTVRRIRPSDLILVIPFVHLALSARRFVFLLVIVAAPVLARQARHVLGALEGGRFGRAVVPVAIAVTLAGVTVTSLTVAAVRPFVDPRKVPGVGAHEETFPEGALRYLDRTGVAGPVFNTFHWGGYIAWRDFPRRIPFVDGRGHVAPDLLEEQQVALRRSDRMERLRARAPFDVVVVGYQLETALKEEVPDLDFGLTSPHWALVYWDDLALVYLRRTATLAAIIERDEYRHVRPTNGALHLRRQLGDAHRRARIEAELRRNAGETGSSMGWALLGFVLNDVGDHRGAVDALGRVRESPFWNHRFNAEQGLAFAHSRLGEVPRAIEHYERAARLGDDPLVSYNLGLLQVKTGDDRAAVRALETAIARDEHLAIAYPPLIAAYRRLGRADRAQALEATYPGVLAWGNAEQHFRRGVRLYLEGRHQAAIDEFQASIKVNPRNPAARSNLGYVYFDLGRLDDAFAEQKTALELDASFAFAQYGLALVHRRRGQDALARVHLAEYLRLEPAGYWSRRAAEELRRLSAR